MNSRRPLASTRSSSAVARRRIAPPKPAACCAQSSHNAMSSRTGGIASGAGSTYSLCSLCSGFTLAASHQLRYQETTKECYSEGGQGLVGNTADDGIAELISYLFRLVTSSVQFLLGFVLRIQ